MNDTQLQDDSRCWTYPRGKCAGKLCQRPQQSESAPATTAGDVLVHLHRNILSPAEQ